MPLVLHKSGDERVRSGPYSRYGTEVFSIAECTAEGILITEFESSGQVVDQVYSKGHGRGVDAALKEYIAAGDTEIVDAEKYEGVTAGFVCGACGHAGLRRELDLKHPSEIHDVPVVPIFVCGACGARHYSMTDKYLKALVKSNRGMFGSKELEEMDSDTEASVASMQEYIIRIFASKKINRMR